MADLELTLSWLGMSQYLDRFVQAGFDSWDTLQCITEGDLETLNVQLGHRRKLQREIANSRRAARDPAFVQPVDRFTPRLHLPGATQTSGHSEAGAKKRTYRHHPKPDPNAPERPYSAYVMFSNHTRDQLKEHGLSFTDLSKQVDERWKSISADEKESWKRRGTRPWKDYKAKLAEYQGTNQYKAYQEYLAEFKAAQAAKTTTGRQTATGRTLTTSELSGNQPSSAPSPSLQQHQSVSSSGSETTVKRLKTDDEPEGGGEMTRSSRVKQACDACRERKDQCSEDRPICRQCKDSGAECRYRRREGGSHRDMDDLWQKIKAYEVLLFKCIPKVDDDDRRAIQDAINLYPQLEGSREENESIAARSESEASSDQGGGEYAASEVGSMGETDRVNQNNFTGQGDSMEFAGQASDTKWRQRLEVELGKDPEHATRSATKKSAIPLSADSPATAKKIQANTEDMDMSIVGDQIYPLELPIRSTADRMVESYFTSIQLSFPIFNESELISQYEEVYDTVDLATYRDRTFIATLQLVFALGAVHAHLVNSEWAGDERDHTLYVANARMLAVDSGILNDLCHLGQARVFALGALYLLATDQINRSWNLAGLAIRSAQSMGMHLLDVTPSLTAAKKDQNARIWFSLTSLESLLTVITGRPSMISARDCSVSLLQVFEKQDKSSSGGSPSDSSQQDLAVKPSSQGLGSSSRVSSQTSTEKDPQPVASIFFIYYSELCIFAKEVVGELYSPGIRDKKWADIQDVIENYDRCLLLWKDDLSPPFDIDIPCPDPESESCRVALLILFHSTRTIIHRPCLCRLDEAIAEQSHSSKRTNRTLANHCVQSARAVLNLIVTKSNSIVLTRGATWWMIPHHFKRSLIVLLLELSFRAEHQPAHADDLLTEAQAALNWLRRIGSSTPGAKHTWYDLSRLLHEAAKRVGGDIADTILAPEDPEFEHQFGGEHSANLPPGQSPGAAAGFDPNDPYGFSSLRLYGGNPLGEWDEFGFLMRAQAGTRSSSPGKEDQEMSGEMQMDRGSGS